MPSLLAAVIAGAGAGGGPGGVVDRTCCDARLVRVRGLPPRLRSDGALWESKARLERLVRSRGMGLLGVFRAATGGPEEATRVRGEGCDGVFLLRFSMLNSDLRARGVFVVVVGAVEIDSRSRDAAGRRRGFRSSGPPLSCIPPPPPPRPPIVVRRPSPAPAPTLTLPLRLSRDAVARIDWGLGRGSLDRRGMPLCLLSSIALCVQPAPNRLVLSTVAVMLLMLFLGVV